VVFSFRSTPLVAACLSCLLSACASLPPDRGFSDVQQLAADRGQTIPAVPSAPDDAARRAEVEAILAQPLTEAGAVRIAFLNNPRILAEYARVGLSGAERLEAGRLMNPTLSGALLFPSAAGAANRYDLGLTQNLASLLLLPARSRFSQGEFERAQLDATQALLDLATDVQTAYYATVGAKQIAVMRKTIATAASASAELSARFNQAGNLSALELAVDQAAASQAKLDQEQAESAVAAAENILNELMGLDADAAWEVSAALPPPVAQEDDLEALRKLAALKRTDLESQRRAVGLLEDSLTLTRDFRYVGDVEVGVQYERDTDRSHLLGPSLALQLPIFNQGQAPLLRAESQLDAARAGLHAKELEISNGVQGAYDRVGAARKRIDRLAGETIPLREQIVARTQAQLNYMLVGVFDLLRVRQDEYSAYQQYLEAVRDYWQARVALAHAIGARLPSDALIASATIAPSVPVQAPSGAMHHHHHSSPSPTDSPTHPAPSAGPAHHHGDSQ